ncbi:methylisocitrate lyase, partial [Bacillus sp. B-TM1]
GAFTLLLNRRNSSSDCSASVQIEDQQLPKKCGHLNGKKLVTTEELVQKIKAIKEVAPSLYIVALLGKLRLHLLLHMHSLFQLLHLILLHHEHLCALQSEEEFRLFNSKVNAPLLANMTEFGKTPYYSAEEFANMGFQMVIYPVTSLRVAAKAYENVFTLIKETGSQKDALSNMQTRSELYETISYHDFEELDTGIAKTVLSEDQ